MWQHDEAAERPINVATCDASTDLYPCGSVVPLELYKNSIFFCVIESKPYFISSSCLLFLKLRTIVNSYFELASAAVVKLLHVYTI